MEATQIIHPDGYEAGIVSNGEIYWVDAFMKLSSGNWVFINGPKVDSRDEAISLWNEVFSKAPGSYSYE